MLNSVTLGDVFDAAQNKRIIKHCRETGHQRAIRDHKKFLDPPLIGREEVDSILFGLTQNHNYCTLFAG